MVSKLEKSVWEVSEQFGKCTSKIQPRRRYRYLITAELILIHVFFLYIITFKLHQIQLWTYLYTCILIWTTVIGIGAGAHRLWTHRSYTAKWPLRLFLMFAYSLSCHLSLFTWVQFHRLHHKFSDTDLDPHNSRRGFFFCHIGWLALYKNPDLSIEEKKIDMSDILNDPIANFHSRFFYTISTVQFFLPSLIPVFAWREDIYLSFMAASILRFVVILHLNLAVNSFNHKFGTKPYNKHIFPTDLPILSFFTFGESWHNYHHTFPWDYKAGEFGDRLNLTSRFLDLCGKVGLASDFKSASPEMIAKMKSGST